MFLFSVWRTDSDERSLVARSFVSSFQLFLPSGDVTTSTVEMIIVIRDLLDGSTEFVMPSIVVESDFQSINRLIDDLQNNVDQLSNNQFVQILSTQNQNMVNQILTAVSQTTNDLNEQALNQALSSNSDLSIDIENMMCLFSIIQSRWNTSRYSCSLVFDKYKNHARGSTLNFKFCLTNYWFFVFIDFYRDKQNSYDWVHNKVEWRSYTSRIFDQICCWSTDNQQGKYSNAIWYLIGIDKISQWIDAFDSGTSITVFFHRHLMYVFEFIEFQTSSIDKCSTLASFLHGWKDEISFEQMHNIVSSLFQTTSNIETVLRKHIEFVDWKSTTEMFLWILGRQCSTPRSKSNAQSRLFES